MYKFGEVAEFTKVFSEEDVFLFAGISGDRNPVHVDREFAAKTRFMAQGTPGARDRSL